MSRIRLSGKVRLASGDTPAEPIQIRRICGADNESYIVGYSDPKGQFQFEMIYTSSAGSPLYNRTRTELCRLVAAAPGFHSSAIPLANRSPNDKSEVGTIILTPLSSSETDFISVTSLAALQLGRYDEAIPFIEKVQSDESGGLEFPQTHHLLGLI